MDLTTDARLFERAVRERWAIPDEAFATMPGEMVTIALDRKRPDRARIAAARTVAMMHGQNQDEQGKHIHHHLSGGIGVAAVNIRDLIGTEDGRRAINQLTATLAGTGGEPAVAGTNGRSHANGSTAPAAAQQPAHANGRRVNGQAPGVDASGARQEHDDK